MQAGWLFLPNVIQNIRSYSARPIGPMIDDCVQSRAWSPKHFPAVYPPAAIAYPANGPKA